METTQHLEIHIKDWGSELWIVNKPEYCSKILKFREYSACSQHWHRLKDEIFYLLKGKIRIRYSDTDWNVIGIPTSFKEKTLYPGDTFHVYPGLRHQMYALEPSELLEVSTQHFDDDSVRVSREW